MKNSAENFDFVVAQCQKAAKNSGRAPDQINLVAVTKTFQSDDIEPVLEKGHRFFGENRVQEAAKKWPELKQKYSNIELHLIGPLQSNKAGEAVALFDVIETIDRDKIAVVIAKEIKKQGKTPDLFVQINTGEETQKAGIAPAEAASFITRCQQEYGLKISGLMCIPPFDENPGPHFALLAKLAREAGLKNLSMGMSGDFETAIQMGATHIRVGSAIFGSR